ncbi:MAG: hypothetical protein K6A96_16210 [Prevotella sp.]|nr:hypothetical protein [Prevotella sp.]
MRKLKLFLAALALMGGSSVVNASVTLETDLTSQFSDLTNWQKWTGATGFTGTQYCPMVEVNGIGQKQVCEKYETTCASTGDIFYQTVTGLTAGTYTIELYGGAAFTFGRGFGSSAFTGEIGTGDAWGTHSSDTYTAGQHIDTETGVFLYATTSEGEYKLEIPIYYATNFPDGASTVTLKNVVIGKNGQVKIGMNKTSQSTNWHVIQLKSVIATVDGETAIANLKATANELLSNELYKNVTGIERTNLQAAVDATPAEETAEAYQAVITALNAAIPVFQNVDYAAYDAYAAYRAETVTLFGEECAATVAAPSTAAEAVTAVQNLNIAQYNKVSTDYEYSLSGLIGDFGDWDGTATVEGANAKPNYLTNEHWSGQPHAYYEQASNGWGSSNWTVQYQKKCNLPAGQYVIKVAARASVDVVGSISCTATPTTVALPNVGAESKGINKAGEASWTGDDFARDGIGYGWQWRFLPFELTEAGEVTITIYAETSMEHNWVSIADGELLSASDVATPVTYNEGETNTIENIQIANVTMNRTVKEGYNTVVLPFTVTANQVAEAFGAGTEVYNFSQSSEDAANGKISFNKGDGSISANTPVLIKAASASTIQTFNGVQIVAADEAKVSGTNFDFVGTYAASVTVPEGDYFIGNGALYKSAGATTLKSFRAYIKAKSGDTARLVIDGVETGIEALDATVVSNGNLYNLNGQMVKNAQKGIFIQKGKKVVLK